MGEAVREATLWPRFIGSVLVVAVLYFAQPVIVPVAVAVLMAFLLSPVVSFLQYRLGKVPAVLIVVVLAFTTLGIAGWAVTQQLANLVAELPNYQHNIHQKIIDIRGAGKGGPVEALQKAAESIQADIEQRQGSGTAARPAVIRPEPVSSLWSFPATIAPLLGPLTTAGLVVVLVVFMLLERESLRNRFIELFGHGRIVATTKAFDEANRRVSRYLFAQSLLNLLFGTGVGIGLYLIGVPYSLLWAALAAALRFIPYVGPVIAAAAPLVVALAALDGWTRPLLVLGLFIGIELLTNLVFETVIYAGAIGVSQVALLIAVAFWSWLWGPLGLLMATPLTVCLVVMGKYVPGFEFVSTLMSDEPALAIHVSYYQRLIAGDPLEAVALLERHLKSESTANVYDGIMLPALNYAERDRIEGRLTHEEEAAVVAATAELLSEVQGTGAPAEAAAASDLDPIPMLGVAAHGESDVVALRMLCDVLRGTPFTLDIKPAAVLSSEVLEEMQRGHYRVVCIADLPPSAPSKSRYVVKRLRAILPDVPLLVGRWAAPEFADDDDTKNALLAAGATYVAQTLQETREHLTHLLPTLAQKSRTAAPQEVAAAPSDARLQTAAPGSAGGSPAVRA
jgi:predicted PurR-regulated permease PerM